MPGSDKNCKIKIIKDGPYIVTGDIPLSEQIIVSKGEGCEYEAGRELPRSAEYSLCRCGKSKNAPFCDGAHEKTGFNGTETASHEKYEDRAFVLTGPNLDLMDDDRCAFARFCHRGSGDAWDLTGNSDNPKAREEAIKAANDCPSGRLVAVDKEGNAIEPLYEPEIVIIQDPERDASGFIFVKGNIPIESSNGQIYEIRNRVALCRCGKSSNKPFCDATHISIKFSDK